MNSIPLVLSVGSFALAIVLLCLLRGVAEAANKEVAGAKVKTWAKLQELPLGSIRPDGWLLRGLELERNGLMGRLDEMAFPFNTEAWLTRHPVGPDPHVARRNRWWAEGWNWAMTSKWLEGTLRCGYLLADHGLIEKASKRINYNLEHQDQDGTFGPQFLTTAAVKGHVSGYTFAEFLHVLMTQYSATSDERIIQALKRYFQDGVRGLSAIPQGGELSGKAADYQIVTALWLYQQTGDQTFLDHARAAFAVNGESDLKELLSERRNTGHGCYWLMQKTIAASMYICTGEQRYLDAVINAYRKLERDQMLIGGVPSSSEVLRGNTALDSAEGCNNTYYPLALKYLLRATGNAAYADKIERAIFNSLPGAMTADFRAHQYLSSSNQVVADGKSNHAQSDNPAAKGRIQLMAYRPVHACPCCAANMPRALPNFVSWMFQKDDRGALTAVLYGSCEVTTTVGEAQKEITISQRTDYPFSERIEFHIGTTEPVSFAFRLRIPGWCQGAQILVNGTSALDGIGPGEFATVSREFHNNDKVMLVLPMDVKLSHWPRGGIGLERGPLVYALRIKEDQRKAPDIIPNQYEAEELYGTDEFPGWDMYAASPWNYALALDKKNLAAAVKVVNQGMSSEPWSIANAPIELQVLARRVSGWKIGKDGLTPQLPDPATLNERLSDKVETVRLVPFGCAKLRISIFPQCNEH